MTVAIVVSRADEASVAIGEALRRQADWTEYRDSSRPDADGGGVVRRSGPFELRSFDDLHVELDDPVPAFRDGVDADREAADEAVVSDDADTPSPGTADDPTGGDGWHVAGEEPDLLVFVSRHAGETGALLTGHFTGNFGPAEYGGADRQLSRAAPSALSAYLGALAAHAPDGYDVGMECTHHGPTDVACPSLFAELGSGEAQWGDPEGARAVAQAVLSLRGVDPHRDHQLVGIGGGHYAPRFGRVARETPWAVGHVASDWQLDELGDPDGDAGRDVLRQLFERSRAEHALVDSDRPAVVDAVEALGYRVVSETWVRTVGDRPLALVAALEARLCPVADGLRFGRVEPGGDDPEAGWTVRDLPDELLAEAQGVDPDTTREAVAAATVAFETVESGTRARGRGAFAVDGDDDAVAGAGGAAADAGTTPGAGAAADDTGATPGDRAPPPDYRELVESLAAVLRESYETVTVETDAVVASETAFDPEKAETMGVPEGPKMGVLAGGDAVEVDGRTIPPEAVRTERTVRFPV